MAKQQNSALQRGERRAWASGFCHLRGAKAVMADGQKIRRETQAGFEKLG